MHSGQKAATCATLQQNCEDSLGFSTLFAGGKGGPSGMALGCLGFAAFSAVNASDHVFHVFHVLGIFHDLEAAFHNRFAALLSLIPLLPLLTLLLSGYRDCDGSLRCIDALMRSDKTRVEYPRDVRNCTCAFVCIHCIHCISFHLRLFCFCSEGFVNVHDVTVTFTGLKRLHKFKFCLRGTVTTSEHFMIFRQL